MGAAEKLDLNTAPDQPGYYRDLPNEVYHSGPGISKSQLDLVRKSPSLLQWSKNAPEDEQKKTALNVGDAVHAKLLEPHRFDAEYAVAPDVDGRTKEGKKAIAEFRETLGNRTALTADEARVVELIHGSVMAHPHAKWIATAKGDVEASIYWTDPGTGLLCRCRPDKLIPEHGWIVDVKTTADINKFSRSVWDYRYHVQDAFYSEGYRQHFGEAPAGFMFLVISTSIECGRYPVRLFLLDEMAKAKGQDHMREDLNTVYDCELSGEWPGVETIGLPHWVNY